MTQHPPFPSMPFMAAFAPIVQLFKGLPRKGPGSEASTRRALALCALPEHPAVADLGCGSGASALLLAETFQEPILALDADGLSLDDLWAFARERGLSRFIQPRCGDLASPGIEPGSLDLLWSEGAIAHIGWAEGLRVWRELLRPGGVMAITDATWLVDDPPQEAERAWAEWYPGMGTTARNLRVAEDLGLQVVGTFTLPSQDWWAYFDPAEERCRALSDQVELAECIAGLRREMELYRRAGRSYGYVFYVLRRKNDPE